MKLAHRSSLGLIAAFVASACLASQPPDVVTSDADQNTAMGTGALSNVEAGQGSHSGGTFFLGGDNTAAGYQSLFSNVTGNFNTAVGSSTLTANTANDNTALGASALQSNTSGSDNTATGWDSLFANTTGSENTATGVDSLELNTTGNSNAAFGWGALLQNTTGSSNTAVAQGALQANTTGTNNTAAGQEALTVNTTGNANVGIGVAALGGNVSGSSNDALGLSALQSNTTGSFNVAVGDHAGYYITGSNNVDIANHGVAGESSTIRIGTTGTQTATYISGIYGKALSGAAVVVTSTGQLGVVASSERFKTDIAPMISDTTGLKQLRPVTFHLKSDPNGPLQYGLIAEEVAKVYPDLVIRDENGRIDGVRYDELAPLLVQKAQQQDARIEQLEQQVAEMKSMQQQLTALLKAQSSEHMVAVASR